MEENREQQVEKKEIKSGDEQSKEGGERRDSRPPRSRRPRRQSGTSTGGKGWLSNAKECISSNNRIHTKRLNVSSTFGNPNKKIKVTPLGGLNQIGGNMTVFETEKSAIIVDVGLSFPNDDMHGVDILVPDFAYVKSIKHKIAGILITHAHEDHIGAVPYIFRELQVPIYGSPMPLAMIGAKFDEHKLSKHKNLFRFIEKRKQIKIGEFEVEWIHITHSVIDASSLAITTDAGTFLHTGDFKLDNTPVDSLPTDYHRLAYYGERGVLALFSDSTNSYNPGYTKSESVVGKTFDTLFKKTKGRVIMSTFSSNVHRIHQAVQAGIDHGRKVAIIGRSMDKNLNLAMELEYLKIDKKKIIDAHEAAKLPENEVLVVTTGSQGEPQSALFRMSIGEHRHIKLKPTDTIVLSARSIPGNENSVSTVINQILKTGAKVVYQEFSEIHVSGHAAQEEQRIMLRLIKPKFFIPAHGEYQHLLKHKETGIACGVDPRNIVILDDGDSIEISQKGIKRGKKVRTGKTFIDNQINKQIDHAIVYDRQNLANDGIIMLIMQIDQQEGHVIGDPKVTSYGLVAGAKERELSKELEDLLHTFVDNIRPEQFANQKVLENSLRQVLKKHIFRKLKKYPIIVPTLFIQ